MWHPYIGFVKKVAWEPYTSVTALDTCSHRRPPKAAETRLGSVAVPAISIRPEEDDRAEDEGPAAQQALAAAAAAAAALLQGSPVHDIAPASSLPA